VAAVCAAALLSGAGEAQAQAPTKADSAAIRTSALDYIEGWFTADSVRMARAVHPALAKRIVHVRDDASPQLQESTAAALIHATATGAGRRIPAERRRTDVRNLDAFGHAASVRIDAGVWIDYLHLAKLGERWMIVNVLWEMQPRR
jgi:hypothetical protein